MESWGTSSPAVLTLAVKLARLSLEVLVTNWTGRPRLVRRETASDTPGSSLSSTWTVPDRSNISPEIFLPPNTAIIILKITFSYLSLKLSNLSETAATLTKEPTLEHFIKIKYTTDLQECIPTIGSYKILKHNMIQ